MFILVATRGYNGKSYGSDVHLLRLHPVHHFASSPRPSPTAGAVIANGAHPPAGMLPAPAATVAPATGAGTQDAGAAAAEGAVAKANAEVEELKGRTAELEAELDAARAQAAVESAQREAQTAAIAEAQVHNA